MKRKLTKRVKRVRRNNESELFWEWLGFDPDDIPGPEDVDDWMAGSKKK